ncbi:3'-5'-exoribonuclease [Ophidiomyces ophidiicola]|uniref:3'-5'-exoribonuclease n=1 Tax=Ophidiomyces ophidiicola TaxID=1387563 RepID=A0ACB8UR84_9EURO|nr:3'-5'-exoribonuclease [Ophidiomyces ophidiicola]KAI1952466.1 3'-5'-exoribonuclease [Ophidiomyces ophidiicola]KAI1969490.1 3'-5'-exoribonuclease [Ophidiomyces ophidiicola]KAI2019380.1 3'-5'-exoribonuclease [Ophidiomyces ophidiicola]KAI2035724.1 3'-5'-exoribonuclease [Ophidiomyces ophidiicola]
MADKRRINGPPGGTRAPVFTSSLSSAGNEKSSAFERPRRTRKANELRKIFLKTGVIPSASGSAYLELQPGDVSYKSKTLIPPTSSLKLICTVHGPKPLPRSAPFSPNLLLSAHIKFAPFASRKRRGHQRDMPERDLAVHLENALGGMLIGDRWPKSGLDVTINVLEGEDDRWWGGDSLSSGPLGGVDGWGLMSVLANCITAAAAAIADARIDCLDLLTGGVAAVVVVEEDEKDGWTGANGSPPRRRVVLDPDPSEHRGIASLCVVGYMPAREEVTEVWLKGDVVGVGYDALVDGAVDSACAAHGVLVEAVKESAQRYADGLAGGKAAAAAGDDNGEDMQL